MLVNSCATSSNNSLYSNELTNDSEPIQVLSVEELFYIRDLDTEELINKRAVITESIKYKGLSKSQLVELNLIANSSYAKPYTKNIIKYLYKNDEALKKNKRIVISLDIDEVYKNYLIQAIANLGWNIELIFDKNNPDIFISSNILDENLPGFCSSFQRDQAASIEKVIFRKNSSEYQDTLVIYEDAFKSEHFELLNNYKNIRSALYTNNSYEIFASNILGVSESANRFKKINALLPNIKINNIPRVRQDIKNIYFLMSYEKAKGLVPAFRYNYSIDINSYASINLIKNISDLNKIIDFESLIIPAPHQLGDIIFLEQFSKNTLLKERLIYDNLHDLIISIYLQKTGIQNAIINGRSGILFMKAGQCTRRELPLKKIDSEGSFKPL